VPVRARDDDVPVKPMSAVVAKYARFRLFWLVQLIILLLVAVVRRRVRRLVLEEVRK